MLAVVVVYINVFARNLQSNFHIEFTSGELTWKQFFYLILFSSFFFFCLTVHISINVLSMKTDTTYALKRLKPAPKQSRTILINVRCTSVNLSRLKVLNTHKKQFKQFQCKEKMCMEKMLTTSRRNNAATRHLSTVKGKRPRSMRCCWNQKQKNNKRKYQKKKTIWIWVC